MSISLFEESLFKNPNQVSPFRQSNQPKGQNQAKLLASLEQLALEKDDEVKNMVSSSIVDGAIAKTIEASGGQKINMVDSSKEGQSPTSAAMLTKNSSSTIVPNQSDQMTKLIFK